jgi:YadA-like C-terminal region./Haemagglutinin.
MKKQILSYLILGSMLSFSNIVSAATVDEAFHYTDQKVDGVVHYVDQKADNLIHYTDQKVDNVVHYTNQKADGVVQYVNQKADGLVHYTDQKADEVVNYVNQKADGLVNYTNQKTDELHQDVKRNEKRIADNFDLIQNNIDKIADNERKLKDHTDVLQKHEDILNGHSQELEKHNKLIVNHDNQITRLTKENLRQDADLLRHEDQIQNHDIQLKNQTERMNNQEKRIDNQDKRLDYLDNRVDNHDARIENHSERIESHERRIEYNKTLATEALKEAKKHTSISAGNNVTVTTSTNAAGGTDYKVSVDKVKFGNVSLDNKGLNNGGNKITNVADGEVSATSKDAVNGSQLYTTNEKITKNTNTIISLGNELNSVRNRMSNLDQRVNKVGAATAALAALHPQDFNPNDKFSAAIGFGNYKDANSVAIGAFYRPNENTLLSIGTTMGSEKMFNAGVSLKFGHHDKMNADTKVAVAKEVQDLVRKYEDLSQKYDNLIKLLNKKEASEFKSDLTGVEENQQYKITRVDSSDTEKGRIERIKATRK